MRIKQVALVISSLAIASLLPISPAEATPTWGAALYWVDEGTTPYSIQSLASQGATPVSHLAWPVPTQDEITNDGTCIYYVTGAGITKVNTTTEATSTFLSTATLGSDAPIGYYQSLAVSNGFLYWAGINGISRANLSTGVVLRNFLTTAQIRAAYPSVPSPVAVANIAIEDNTIVFSYGDWSTGLLGLYDITNSSDPTFSTSGGTLTKITYFGSGFLQSDTLTAFDPAGFNTTLNGLAINATDIYLSTSLIARISRSDITKYFLANLNPLVSYGSTALTYLSGTLYFAAGSAVGTWDYSDPIGTPNNSSKSLSSTQAYGITAMVAATPASVSVKEIPIPSPPQTSVIETATNLSTSTEGGKVTLTGKFIAPVTNIALNGKNLSEGSWIQEAEKIVITLPAGKTGIGELQIYNGQIPLLQVQEFAYVEPKMPASVPTPTPTESSKPTPTETQAATEPSAPTASPLPSTIKVYFDMNSARLVPKSEARVASLVAQLVARQGIVVTVTGYVQPTRVNPNEKALSLARARAVITALKSAGVHGSFIAVAGGTAPENTASSRYAKIEITQK
jgi:outer membrane protein OmpA-like peptidoglycan-associated protein